MLDNFVVSSDYVCCRNSFLFIVVCALIALEYCVRLTDCGV